VAKDYAALKAALETDTKYDAAVVGGNNNELKHLLLEPDEALPKRWRPISVDDFLDTIAGESLTAEQEERIRTYTLNREQIPVHKPNIRAWCIANFSADTLANLQALAQQDGRPIDAYFTDDDRTVSLDEIRQIVLQIPKAYVNQADARAAARAPRVAQAAAQREAIRQAVTAGYPESIREEIQNQFPDRDRRIAAEVRLQDRAARTGSWAT
jgi:hypothetical protein